MADDPAQSASAAPTVPCKFCRQPIPAGARYCTHCEKFQSPWDRFRWGASISGLVSLISVGTLAYGFLAKQLQNAEAQVVLTPVVCQADQMRVALANLGDRPALFQGGTVVLAPGGAAPTVTRTLVSEDVPSLLPAQSSKITTLQVAALASPHLPLPFDPVSGNASACQFRLQLVWTDGHNRQHNDTKTCACGS